jgi:hypothetical protein
MSISVAHLVAIRRPTEHQIQAAYFQLVRLKLKEYPLIYAVPNGSNKSPMQRVKFQREGLTPGILDVNIDYPRKGYHGMRIEFKRDSKISLSDEQRVIAEQLFRAGYHVAKHWDPEEAFNATQEYLLGE